MIIKTLGMAHQPTAISWAKLKIGNLEKSADFDASEFLAAAAIYVRHGDDFDEILEIFEKNSNIQDIHENLGVINPLFLEKLFLIRKHLGIPDLLHQRILTQLESVFI